MIPAQLTRRSIGDVTYLRGRRADALRVGDIHCDDGELAASVLVERCSLLADFGSRQVAKTCHPSSRYCRVNSKPSPRLAPVISAISIGDDVRESG